MTPLRWIAAIALVALAAVGGWFGYQSYIRPAPPPVDQPAADTGQVAAAPTLSDRRTEVVTVEGAGVDGPPTGGTPMAERVAVIGLLNKRNGASRDLMLKPGQATRVGDAVVRLRACERTAPWEQEQYTGAFLQLDVLGSDAKWRRVFSGWTFRERPALNVVQHPIYDVWVKSCTMSWPATGPDTVPAGGGANGGTGRASSASNAPETTGAPSDSPAEDAPSASPSNAI